MKKIMQYLWGDWDPIILQHFQQNWGTMIIRMFIIVVFLYAICVVVCLCARGL